LFTFNPVAKFWLSFNHRPAVADDSHGFWRRVHMIPFNRQFDTVTEPDLTGKLRGEAPGVLAWAVRGCLEWQRHGLQPPATVVAAIKTYREESDPLRDFVADRCTLHPDAQITVADLWSEYNDWYLHQSVAQRFLNRPAFTRRVKAHGCREIRYGHGRDWTWQGICRRVDSETQGPAAADVRTDADVNLQ
jgi:putative DNA primase/helicase